MIRVVSTFFSDVFQQSEPNLDRFRGNFVLKCIVLEVLCNSVDVKSLDFSEVVEFGTMLLYAETLMLSSLMKTCQNTQRNASSEYIHQMADRARAVVLEMDRQALFPEEECPNLSTNTIRLSISCMVCKSTTGIACLLLYCTLIARCCLVTADMLCWNQLLLIRFPFGMFF